MSEPSRQRAWQLKKQAEGCCTQCGTPKEPEATGRRCLACVLKAKETWKRLSAKRREAASA